MNEPQQQTHNMLAFMSSQKTSSNPTPSPPKPRIAVFIAIGVVVIAIIYFRFINIELLSEPEHDNENSASSATDNIEQFPTEIKENQIVVGSIVVIQEGAVYGGLTSDRGHPVPSSQIGSTTHTVMQIEIHRGEEEALLKEIYSWVALRWLQL